MRELQNTALRTSHQLSNMSNFSFFKELRKKDGTLMYIGGTFCQGTDGTMAAGFALLGPPLLPWENRMGKNQAISKQNKKIGQITQPLKKYNFFLQEL